MIQVKAFYDQTQENMNTEYNLWIQAQKEWKEVNEWESTFKKIEEELNICENNMHYIEWIQWKQWSSKEDSFTKHIESLRSIIETIDIFLIEYKNYDEIYKMIEEETKNQELYSTWKQDHDEIESQLKEYILEYEKVQLEKEFLAWEQGNKFRIDLF